MLRRAVVLGGGGVTGVAWEMGLLQGLAEAGVDLGTADLLVGTSAGSVVAAQVASGVSLEAMFARQVESASGEIGARIGWTYGLRLLWPWLRGGGSPERFRTRVGALARAARTVPEEDRRAVIAARLPVHEWPDRPLMVTAVDASDGTFVVFDRDTGVPLVDAVAASCAVPLVWPPVTVGSRRFVDGGIRSVANADLAAGFDSIVIVAPLARGGGPIPGPRSQADAFSGRRVARPGCQGGAGDSGRRLGCGNRLQRPGPLAAGTVGTRWAAAGGLGGCRDLSSLVIARVSDGTTPNEIWVLT